MFQRCGYFLLFCCFIFSSVLKAETYTLSIPVPLNGDKSKNPFIEALLTEIFAAENLQLVIKYNKLPANKKRLLKLLQENKSIDLFWAITTSDREKDLLAIKKPIYNGYIGWRLLLIKKGTEDKFQHITSLADFSNLVGLQKHDWLDNQILQYNGLKIKSNMSFTGMFKALETGLADYFPRSILEIEKELHSFAHDNLVIEPRLLLKYPSYSYFFVNKNNQFLANTLSNGFNKIINNGRYQALFNQYFKSISERLNLQNRKVITLKNPHLNVNSPD